MLGSPPDLEGRDVLELLRSVDGVVDVHHVHLWQMQEDAAAVDEHVVLETGHWDRVEEIKATLKDRLLRDFGIAHSTLEFENGQSCSVDAPLFGHDRPVVEA